LWISFQSASPSLIASQEEETWIPQIIIVKTEAELISVLDRLKSGESFSDLARECSTHPTAKEEGYWEDLADEELVNELNERFDKAGEEAILYFHHSKLGYTIVRKQDRAAKKKHQVNQALHRGGQYLKNGQVRQAIEEFKRAVSLDPLSAEAHMLLGYSYRLSGDYNMAAEAKAEFRQALVLDPTLAWASFYLAKMYIDLGRLSNAKDQLQDAVELHPNIPELSALLGEVHRQLGEPELSAQLNKKVLDFAPSNTAAHYYLGLAYRDLEREEEALEQFQISAGLEGASAEVYISLGSMFVSLEEPEKAIEPFEKAIELDPSQPYAHLGLARAYRLMGELDAALEKLEQTLPKGRAVPSSPYFQEVRTEIYFERGLIHQDRKHNSKAITAFSKALEMQASYGKAHRQLAEVLFEEKEYRRAEEHAEKAETLQSPVDPSLRQKIREKLRNGS
jgi:tetratricopeptide (TPR) repeat protein